MPVRPTKGVDVGFDSMLTDEQHAFSVALGTAWLWRVPLLDCGGCPFSVAAGTALLWSVPLLDCGRCHNGCGGWPHGCGGWPHGCGGWPHGCGGCHNQIEGFTVATARIVVAVVPATVVAAVSVRSCRWNGNSVTTHRQNGPSANRHELAALARTVLDRRGDGKGHWRSVGPDNSAARQVYQLVHLKILVADTSSCPIWDNWPQRLESVSARDVRILPVSTVPNGTIEVELLTLSSCPKWGN